VALTEHYHTKFEEGGYYHIYNQTVDKQPMFRNSGNYVFFLIKYDEYLSPVLNTYAYCLLGNHFHLLVRVQDLTTFRNSDLTTFQKLSNLTNHDIVSRQFRKFFQSYAMAFNKQHDRIGTLFQTPFKRILIDNSSYFTRLVYYIHNNPQHHKLVDIFKDWIWSSYGSIIADKPSKLKRDEVINWYGNKINYEKFHLTDQKINPNEKFILEEE